MQPSTSTTKVRASDGKSESDGSLFARHCPLNFCRTHAIEKLIDLGTNPNAQCDFNHAGLCGGCENNYNLAIGSSHCV